MRVWILVLRPPRERPMAWFSPAFFGAPALVLMGAHDGAVDHRIFVVGILGQVLEDALPDAGLGPATEAAVDVLPVAKTLRQVTPGDAGAIAVEHGVDEQAVICRGHTDAPWPARQVVFDPLPLVVTQGMSVHRSASPKLTAYESKNRRRWNRGATGLSPILPHCCSPDPLGWSELTTRPKLGTLESHRFPGIPRAGLAGSGAQNQAIPGFRRKTGRSSRYARFDSKQTS